MPCQGYVAQQLHHSPVLTASIILARSMSPYTSHVTIGSSDTRIPAVESPSGLNTKSKSIRMCMKTTAVPLPPKPSPSVRPALHTVLHIREDRRFNLQGGDPPCRKFRAEEPHVCVQAKDTGSCEASRMRNGMGKSGGCGFYVQPRRADGFPVRYGTNSRTN